MRAALAALLALCAILGQAQTTIRMMANAGYGIPPKEATSTNVQVRRAVFDAFHKANPDVRVVNAGGLTLGGDFSDNTFLMSMAGGDGPDVFYVNFRQYHTYLDQGFCRPLEDLIAKDPQVMARVNPTVDKVLRSYDGKRYAVPFFQVAVALYYRRDFFQAAGLDPNRPPRTWAEFREYARRLTTPGRFGFELGSKSYHWQNFLYQAGGEVVRQDADGRWHAAVATPEASKALEFYRDLATAKWTVNGKTVGPAENDATDLSADIREGKTAMWLGYTNDVVLNTGDLPPSVIGIAALPAGPAGRRNEVNAGMWAISSKVKDPKKLDACWRFIKFFASDEAARVNTAKCVELGLGAQVNPVWLKKFGYADLVRSVDPSYVEANESLFKTGHPEPYGRNCQQIYAVLDDALDRARLEPHTPPSAILAETAREMDRKLLGFTPKETLERQRGWAWGVLAVLGFGILVWGLSSLALSPRPPLSQAKEGVSLPAGLPRERVWGFVLICLLPAALSVLTWAYYPLGRGLTMAFQDYRLLGGSRWVGVDNFVAVFTQPVFWRAMLNSFVYVGLSIAVGFLLPIFLALALAEIPVGKTFFRTVFYLPAMTSPVVIAFLWRQFYDKTDAGVLNGLVRPVVEHVLNPLGCHLPTSFDWLGDPSLAMFAVVLPGIWAGAGTGSILYLAALKNISEDRYEAADLDGATWLQKIRHITLPGLKPLILINLLGVFIGGFKAMENVFVLTQGGPLNATRTLGLEVWQNAFMYLRFGYATAAAWVMGSILVGFTLIQIRTLLRMRFTTAR